jgi:ribulose-phosphate 3-epimerase
MIESVPDHVLIAPSILAADFRYLGKEIKEAEAAGADWIHIDVMDGHYVPNITMGPVIVEACKKSTDLPLDVHLMVEGPEAYLKAFADAGAASLTVHIEASTHLHRTLQAIRELGLHNGVALNPSTPGDSVSEILDMTDLILVMTVNPGFGGQDFISSTISKIRKIRTMIEETGRPIRLQVDGGISKGTAPLAADAGADVFVAGSAIFRHPEGIAKGVEDIKASLSGLWG